MPDIPPNAAPAAADAPPPAAPAADTNTQHPAVPELMKRLLSSVDDDTPPADPPGERRREAPAAADPKPADPKPAEPKPAAEPPIKARKPKPPERPVLPVKAAAPKPAPAEPPADAAAEAAWEKTLDENEREMLEEARFAESQLPTQHAGLGAKVQKFLKEHESIVNAPDFDPDSREYKQWLDQHQPRLTPSQQRAIQETRISQRVQKEADSKISDVRHDLFVRDQEPTIKAHGQQIFNEMVPQVLAKEIIAAIQADAKLPPDKKTARNSYALEIDVANEILSAARADIEEFQRITVKNPETGRTIKPITNSAQHQQLAQLVQEICSGFRDPGGAQCVRNGRWFVTRDEFHALPDAEKQKFWTFTNKEIIDLAKARIPGAVKQAIAAKIAANERMGFRRTPPPAPAAAPAPEPHRGAAAAPRPSPAPAGGGGGLPSEGARLAANLNR